MSSFILQSRSRIPNLSYPFVCESIHVGIRENTTSFSFQWSLTICRVALCNLTLLDDFDTVFSLHLFRSFRLNDRPKVLFAYLQISLCFLELHSSPNIQRVERLCRLFVRRHEAVRPEIGLRASPTPMWRHRAGRCHQTHWFESYAKNLRE